MFWHQQKTLAKSIFLNFQHLINECIQNTNPTKEYFFEKKENDCYFASQVPFPLMNGIISEDYEVKDIHKKCQALKEKFHGATYPLTWFWVHDILPEEINEEFNSHGFKSLGKYTSVAVELNKIQKHSVLQPEEIDIKLVETDKQFDDFLEITKIVYGMSKESLPFMRHLYSAYKYSTNIRLYLANINNTPAATLLTYQNGKTMGLYNGATLTLYRKQGLLTLLIINAVKDSSGVEHFVAQLMASQEAKGVCDKLGFKEYSHFYPFVLDANGGIS